MSIKVEWVDVDVDVSSVGCAGVGDGDATPGECMVPANADTARVRLRAKTAPVWRNLFTCGAS